MIIYSAHEEALNHFRKGSPRGLLLLRGREREHFSSGRKKENESEIDGGAFLLRKSRAGDMKVLTIYLLYYNGRWDRV